MRALTLISSALCLLVSANGDFLQSSDAAGTTQVDKIMKLESLKGITKENSEMGRLQFDNGPDGKIRRTGLNSFERVASGSVTDPANIRTRGYEPSKKHLEVADFTDEVPLSFAQINNEPINGHPITIYDMTKKIFGNDRGMGRVQVALLPRTEFLKKSNELRPMRTDDTENQKRLEDLEENGSRDFQPLFSAKEEPAKQRSARLVEAYGAPKKIVDSNGEIERVQMASPPRAVVSRHPSHSMSSRTSRSIDSISKNKLNDLNSQEAKIFQPLFVHKKQISARRKSGRLLDAYSTPKQTLNNNERVHRLHMSSTPTVETSRFYRTTRSIDTESKNGLEDLEGQDAKVFRPVFVYRQQVAARQRRLEEKRKSTHTQKSHPSRATTKPYGYWRPFY